MSRAARRIGLSLAVAVVVALAATLALRLYGAHRLERAVERFEAEAGSLDLSTYALPAVEPSANAAHWLRAGAGALVFDGDDYALLDRRIAGLGEPWPPGDQEAFLEHLEENAAARVLLGRAGDLERASFEIEYARGAEAQIPDFLSLLRAGRLLAVECDLRQQRGEMAAALEALHLLERLTAAQRAEPVLIALLAGSAVERLYLDRLDAMLQTASDPATLIALSRDLDHLESVTLPARVPFAADIAATYLWVVRHGGDRPEWAPLPKRRRLLAAARPALMAIGFDRLVAAMLLEAGTRTVASVETPAARIDADRYSREVIALGGSLPGAAALARELAPNYLDAVKRAQWTRSARALARVALDLRLSRIGHGAYPRTPQHLPTSAATGETATFRLLDDGSIELAFPEAESSWEDEKKAQAGQTGKITTADLKLRWRLPP